MCHNIAAKSTFTWPRWIVARWGTTRDLASLLANFFRHVRGNCILQLTAIALPIFDTSRWFEANSNDETIC